MKEQKYVLKNKESFELKHIFECGQCFRWNINPDGSYVGVVKNNVIRVKAKENEIVFTSLGEEDLKSLVISYFDMNTDYSSIKNKLSKVDAYLEQSIDHGSGIRILKQDLWEMIISFIISANNNIPRIKGIIERISKAYGNKIVWDGVSYYTFPTVEELSRASVADLRKLGLGFRDQRVYETTQMLKANKIDLEQLKNNLDLKEVRNTLLTLQGVGPKVADCILLFGMHRFEVFPIDVWVRRVMNELYIQKQDETKVKKEEIEKLAEEKYEKLAGIAQQYLFYWKRETA